MKLIPNAIVRGCAWPFKAAARIYRKYVIPPVKAAGACIAGAARWIGRAIAFPFRMFWRWVATPIFRFVLKPIATAIAFPFRMLWRWVATPIFRFILKPVAMTFWRLVPMPIFNYILKPVARAIAWSAKMLWRFLLKPIWRFLLKPIWRFLLKPIWRFLLRPIWSWRRPLIGLATVAAGLGIIYGGYYVVLPMQSPQKIWYNKGVSDIRGDFENKRAWSSFKSPDVPNLQKSILYFNNQADAGLLDRLLYGAPDVELASQAYLKVGVILLYNATDEKLVAEAKDYLERAVLLNPGILYARELLADITTIDRLGVLALAPERNLEMLYQKHPESRSKKPDKSKDGKGDESKDPKQGDQKGEPDQPNDEPGKDDPKQGEEAPASKNDSLQQNMQDVKNGVGNDGI